LCIVTEACATELRCTPDTLYFTDQKVIYRLNVYKTPEQHHGEPHDIVTERKHVASLSERDENGFT